MFYELKEPDLYRIIGEKEAIIVSMIAYVQELEARIKRLTEENKQCRGSNSSPSPSC